MSTMTVIHSVISFFFAYWHLIVPGALSAAAAVAMVVVWKNWRPLLLTLALIAIYGAAQTGFTLGYAEKTEEVKAEQAAILRERDALKEELAEALAAQEREHAAELEEQQEIIDALPDDPRPGIDADTAERLSRIR